MPLITIQRFQIWLIIKLYKNIILSTDFIQCQLRRKDDHELYVEKLKALSQHLTEETKNNSEKSHSGYPITGLSFNTEFILCAQDIGNCAGGKNVYIIGEV